MVERLTGLVDDAVAAGLLRPEADAEAIATSLILLCHGWTLKGYLLKKSRTPAVYAQMVIETAIQGWATPQGRSNWERRRV